MNESLVTRSRNDDVFESYSTLSSFKKDRKQCIRDSYKDFKQLEEAALAAFKLGYDVEDPAELELEDGSKIWGFDVVVESELDTDVIMEDVDKLSALALNHGVEYDGWGTYFQE